MTTYETGKRANISGARGACTFLFALFPEAIILRREIETGPLEIDQLYAIPEGGNHHTTMMRPDAQLRKNKDADRGPISICLSLRFSDVAGGGLIVIVFL